MFAETVAIACNDTELSQSQIRRASVTQPIRGVFQIYIDGKIAAENAEKGRFRPMVVIRSLKTGDLMYCRDAYWNGPSRFIFNSNGSTLPGTAARSWIETDHSVCVNRDGELLMLHENLQQFGAECFSLRSYFGKVCRPS